MTSIFIPADDTGVQALRAQNTQPQVTRAVPVTAPITLLGAPRLPGRQLSRSRPRRRQAERRQSERRKHKSKVLLETRSPHERRSINGQRRSDRLSRRQAPPRGINVIV